MRYEWVWDSKNGYVKKRKVEFTDIVKGILLFFAAKKVVGIASSAAKSIIEKYVKSIKSPMAKKPQ